MVMEELDSERWRAWIGEPVTVMFADGGIEEGWLESVGQTTIDVRHIDMRGGGHMWTATYSLVGDADTPAVVEVRPIPSPAEEAAVALF